MRYTILFALTLVVVSGLIAYTGDILGRKMGKKRLTLFGMRPKYTAIVATTITGMLIAGLTIAVLLGVSSTMREVLLEGEQKISALKSRNVSLQSANTSLQSEAHQLTSDFERAQKNYREAIVARDSAATKVRNLTSQIAAKLTELNDLRRKKKITEAQLEDKVQLLLTLGHRLDTMQTELARTNRLLASAGAELDKARKTVEVQRAAIAEQQITLKAYQDQMEEQYKRFGEVAKENLNWNLGYDSLRRGNVVIKQGQELNRRVISQVQSVENIKFDVLAVLNEASSKAKQFGAGVGKNGKAVTLVAPGASVEEISCVDALAESISKSKGPVLVQVLAFSNTIRNEQTFVAIQPFRNELIFSKGVRLANTSIDGRQPEGRILISIVNFLRTEVRNVADKAGVVPIENSDPAIAGDEQMIEFLDLVSKIKKIDAPISLRVTAKRDIYSVGPLDMKNMEFSISTAVAKLSDPAGK